MSIEIVRATVSRERNFNAFAELSHANYCLLQNAECKRDGWFYECLAATTVCAFKFEAFLNLLGPIVFVDWKKKAGRKAIRKLSAIYDHLGIECHATRRPFVTVSDLFRFRNQVAHAKSKPLKSVSIEVGTREQLRRNKPLMEWEKLCSVEFAKCCYQDTESIAEELWKAAGRPESELRERWASYNISDAVAVNE